MAAPHFATWLHRICANCSLDLIRARKRKQDLYPHYDMTTPSDPFAHLPSESPSPERLAQSSQIAAILLPALD